MSCVCVCVCVCVGGWVGGWSCFAWWKGVKRGGTRIVKPTLTVCVCVPVPALQLDVIKMDVIEMVERKDGPLFAAECLLLGEYQKYNNNTGALVHDVRRDTPQTFSHFTFERSHHRCVSVGCGQLATCCAVLCW